MPHDGDASSQAGLDRLAAAVQAEPTSSRHLEAWGRALMDARQAAAAVEAFTRAVALHPTSPDLLCCLGNAQRLLDDTDGAIGSYLQAIAVDGAFIPAMYNLLVLLLDLGRIEEALTLAAHLHRVGQGAKLAQYGVGLTLYAAGRFAEATEFLERVALQSPEQVDAWMMLGSSLHAQARYHEAETAFRRVLALDPHRQEGLTRLAEVRLHLWDEQEARSLFQRAGAVAPSAGLLLNQALCLPGLFADDDHLAAERADLLAQINALAERGLTIDDPQATSCPALFTLAYHGLDDRPLMEAVARFLQGACPSLQWVAPHCRKARRPTPDRPVRIGIVSRYLYGHTMGRYIQPWIAGLDRRQYHVSLWLAGGRDRFTDRMAANADHVARLTGSLQAMRDQLATAELDVLLYPGWFDPVSYFLAFARLAPIQVVAWGQPSTSGIPSLDYFLSERDMEADGAAAHYTETLVPLVGMPTYCEEPLPARGQPDRAAFGFAADWHLYGCLQTLLKFQPGFDALIAEILRRDPLGRFVFSATQDSWTAQWRARFTAKHPDVADRLIAMPALSWDRFIALTRALDVVLDPPAFSGGRTTYDTLLAGTPIVTLPGPLMRSRQTLAYLRKIDLTDTVATDAETYVATANRIALDPDWRSHLTRRIEAGAPVLQDAEPLNTSFQAFLAQVTDRR